MPRAPLSSPSSSPLCRACSRGHRCGHRHGIPPLCSFLASFSASLFSFSDSCSACFFSRSSFLSSLFASRSSCLFSRASFLSSFFSSLVSFFSSVISNTSWCPWIRRGLHRAFPSRRRLDVKSVESVFTDCGSAFVPNYGSSAEYKSKKKYYIPSLSALRYFITISVKYDGHDENRKNKGGPAFAGRLRASGRVAGVVSRLACGFLLLSPELPVVLLACLCHIHTPLFSGVCVGRGQIGDPPAQALG